MDTQNTAPLQTVPEVRLVAEPLPMRDRPIVNSSFSAYELLRPLFLEEMETRERFVMLLLDRGNRVKGSYLVSIGGLHGTVADPKLIFCAALKTLSSSIILAHNHPSGQLRPSEEDLKLTRKLVDGARLLDLVIHDHIIMATEGYYSFADNGTL